MAELATGPRAAVAVGTRVQIFVDDYLVAQRDGVTERPHAVTKDPAPVLTASAPWERPAHSGLAGWVNAHYDPDIQRFKLWYYSRGTINAGGSPFQPAYQLYATSADGIHFERPALGLVEHDGSTANNILGQVGAGAPADIWHGMLDCADMAGVEAPEFRYKALRSTGRDAAGYFTHSASFSADGLRWSDAANNPAFRVRHAGDTITAAKLREGYYHDGPPGFPTAKYAAFPKLHVPIGSWNRRAIGMSTCNASAGGRGTPFMDWSEPVLVLAPDALDDEMAQDRLDAGRAVLRYDHPEDRRCEFYGLMVYRTGDVFLGLLWIFDAAFEMRRIGNGNQHGLVDVQLVSSRDLVHWHRCGGRQPVIPRGTPGSFDAAMIFYHSFPIPMGDQWCIYYAGFDTCHRSTEDRDLTHRDAYLADVRAGRRQMSAIGRATVRQNGFVSLDAGTGGGTLTTRPLLAGGPHLELNADVAPGGELRVDVLDAGSQPLPGYAAVDCVPMTGDSVRHRVRWQRRDDGREGNPEIGSDGRPPWPGPIRLRFSLRNAALYAFRFTE